MSQFKNTNWWCMSLDNQFLAGQIHYFLPDISASLMHCITSMDVHKTNVSHESRDPRRYIFKTETRPTRSIFPNSRDWDVQPSRPRRDWDIPKNVSTPLRDWRSRPRLHPAAVSGKCFFQLRHCFGFAVHLMKSQWPHWCTCSSPQESTTATVCWSAHQQQQTKLQRVMNTAARVVTNTRKLYRGLTPRSSLAGCHWLHQIQTVSTFTSVYMAWHHNTYMTSVYAGRRSCGTTSSLCWLWTASYPKVQGDNLQRTFIRLHCAIHTELSSSLTQSRLGKN